MKKLQNGWLKKKSFQKAITMMSVFLLAIFAFCLFLVFTDRSSTLNVILIILLGVFGSMSIYTFKLNGDNQELGLNINKVYETMDPQPYYDFMNSLDLDILHDEVLCKLNLFKALFLYFEGNKDEAHAIMAQYQEGTFPYVNLLTLKILIEIYLLDDKEDGYILIEQNANAAQEYKIKDRVKQQLIREINSLSITVDAYLGRNVDDRLIEGLKQPMSTFGNCQNKALLTLLLKDSDLKCAYESKEYVIENCGKFVWFKDFVEGIELAEYKEEPVETNEEIEEQETKSLEEQEAEIMTLEEPVISDEEANEHKDQECK